MDPRPWAPPPAPAWLPRTRGDGPVSVRFRAISRGASPHTRGWTLAHHAGIAEVRGFPAHAGMDRRGATWCATPGGLPRTRGDGPARRAVPGAGARASPHTRGWTQRAGASVFGDIGFPAHAGMDPSDVAPVPGRGWLPRTRGDGPGSILSTRVHQRASPHTRGWTRHSVPVARPSVGFPAHAGMDPALPESEPPTERLPRTRGDGPRCAPSTPCSTTASPHTRGWTRPAVHQVRRRRGFPAHAGMDPPRTRRRRCSARLPRTRGDGPGLGGGGLVGNVASPHTRGWTSFSQYSAMAFSGFPAHAGMDPRPRGMAPGRRGLPRTRGDGPDADDGAAVPVAASPHTRGWTSTACWTPRRAPGFPAHAGMDPARRRGSRR